MYVESVKCREILRTLSADVMGRVRSWFGLMLSVRVRLSVSVSVHITSALCTFDIRIRTSA